MDFFTNNSPSAPVKASKVSSGTGKPQQNRHPERSASQVPHVEQRLICAESKDLGSAYRGDAVRKFSTSENPKTAYRSQIKHSSTREICEALRSG
jgi:hypothetical protein